MVVPKIVERVIFKAKINVWFFLVDRFGSKIDEPNGGRRSTRKRVLDDRLTMPIRNHVPVSRFRRQNSKQKKSKLINATP